MGEDTRLWEPEPLSHLLNSVPHHSNKGLFTTDVRWSCLDVTKEFIAIGSTTSMVYLYDRENHAVQKINIKVKNAIVTCLKLKSSVDYVIAAGTNLGVVCVITLPSNLPGRAKQLQMFHISGLHPSTVRCAEWSQNAMKLFTGDEDGIVVCSEIDYSKNEGKSFVLCKEPHSLVQLNYTQKMLLVSTKWRTVICYTDKNNQIVQIGQRDRKILGHYGALFKPTEISTQKVDTVYACRPGLRLWKADHHGTVQNTLMFRKLIPDSPSGIELLPASTIGLIVPDPLEEKQFGPLKAYEQDSLISYSSTSLYVVNPLQGTLVAFHNNIGEILDLAVCEEEIFILRKVVGRIIMKLTSRRPIIGKPVSLPDVVPPLSNTSTPEHVPRPSTSGRSKKPTDTFPVEILSETASRMSQGLVVAIKEVSGKIQQSVQEGRGNISAVRDTNFSPPWGASGSDDKSRLSPPVDLPVGDSTTAKVESGENSTSSNVSSPVESVDSAREVSPTYMPSPVDEVEALPVEDAPVIRLDSNIPPLECDAVLQKPSEHALEDLLSSSLIQNDEMNRSVTSICSCELKGHSPRNIRKNTEIVGQEEQECLIYFAKTKKHKKRKTRSAVILDDNSSIASSESIDAMESSVYKELDTPLPIIAKPELHPAENNNTQGDDTPNDQTVLCTEKNEETTPQTNDNIIPINFENKLIVEESNQNETVESQLPILICTADVGTKTEDNDETVSFKPPSTTEQNEIDKSTVGVPVEEPMLHHSQKQFPFHFDFASTNTSGGVIAQGKSDKNISPVSGTAAHDTDVEAVSSPAMVEGSVPVLSPAMSDASSEDFYSMYITQSESSYSVAESVDVTSAKNSIQDFIQRPPTPPPLESAGGGEEIPTGLAPQLCQAVVDIADTWTEVAAPAQLQNICLTQQHLWCVDKGDIIYYTELSGPGLRWRKINVSGNQMAVSPNGTVIWRLHKNTVHVASGVSRSNPAGRHWREVARDVAYVAVDNSVAWYVKLNGEAVMHKGLSRDRPSFRPVKVDSPQKLLQICCHQGAVWALTEERNILVRTGVCCGREEGENWAFITGEGPTQLGASIAVDDQECVWLVDLLGRVWFTRGVTSSSPQGDGQWWQVSLSDYLMDDTESIHSRWSMAELQRNLGRLTTGSQGGLVCAGQKGTWVCRHYGNVLHICRSSLMGHRWENVVPGSMLPSTRWLHVSASALGEENGMVWAQQPNGAIFAFPPENSKGRLIEVVPPNPEGEGSGSLLSLCASQEGVWGISPGGRVHIRSGLHAHCPQGLKWEELNLTQLGDTSLVQASCGVQNVWAVDSVGSVFLRIGLHRSTCKQMSPAWVPVDGATSTVGAKFTQVFIGPNEWMVWATDNKKAVYARKGIRDEMPIGTHWANVSGTQATSLCISDKLVYAINPEGELLVRYGIEQENPLGEFWKKIPGNFSTISVSKNDDLWAIDNDGLLCHRFLCALQRSLTLPNVTGPTQTETVEGDWEMV